MDVYMVLNTTRKKPEQNNRKRYPKSQFLIIFEKRKIN